MTREIANIRKAILDQKKPFCQIDLFNRLERDYAITDREAILDVLDELFNIGLVEYKFVGKTKNNLPGYAYVVVV